MIIQNGDHMQYELDNANVPKEQRSDWPLPSFDARDWAKAFCQRHPTVAEDDALGWFANALMRGFDEHANRASDEKDCACPGGQAEHLKECVYCR